MLLVNIMRRNPPAGRRNVTFTGYVDEEVAVRGALRHRDPGQYNGRRKH